MTVQSLSLDQNTTMYVAGNDCAFIVARYRPEPIDPYAFVSWEPDCDGWYSSVYATKPANMHPSEYFAITYDEFVEYVQPRLDDFARNYWMEQGYASDWGRIGHAISGRSL